MQLEDCALQLYKVNGAQGDFGSFLDLDLSLDEQWDELEGFTEGYFIFFVALFLFNVCVHWCSLYNFLLYYYLLLNFIYSSLLLCTFALVLVE